MNKRDKAEAIGRELEELYPDPAIPLEHRDPYTLLIAVLLSAQCTDVMVNRVSPRLFAKASVPEDMAALPLETIQEIIRPCGLSPAKAKAIKGLSAKLVELHGGQVPKSMEALEALPGVGHKTASVVLIQAFGVPAFPVDTHIHRLAYRWGLSSGRNVEQTERDLKSLFPENCWSKLHLQIIYYGREYCPARGHVLGHCGLCRRYGLKSRLGTSTKSKAGRAKSATAKQS